MPKYLTLEESIRLLIASDVWNFSETSSETFDDKIKRLMLNDLANLEKKSTFD